METGLGCDVDALGAGLAQQWDYFHSGKVDNVQGEIWAQVGQGKDLFHGSGFVCGWSGCQEGGIGLDGSGWFV